MLKTSEKETPETIPGNTRSFYYYLKERGLAVRTIGENVKDLERFIEWSKESEELSFSQERRPVFVVVLVLLHFQVQNMVYEHFHSQWRGNLGQKEYMLLMLS